MRAVEAMTPEQAEHSLRIVDEVSRALTSSMADSDRSEWTKGHRIGASDIGHCREYLRRVISQQPFTDEQDNYAAAFMGTAVGALAEEAMTNFYPGDRSQLDVEVKLTIGSYVLVIPGHPDLLHGDTLIDFKTVDGLGVIRRTGPSEKQKYQITLYAKALIDRGDLPADAWLSLVYIDRSGRERDPVVFSWRYDPVILGDAMEWLADVIYALEHEEEASRDMPRDWCWECCPFVSACRGTDTDVQGIIDEPLVIDAVEIYLESNEQIRKLEKDKKSALSVLKGRSGVVGDHVLRWIHIDGSEYTVKRDGYDRIHLKPVDRAEAKARKRTKREESTDERQGD